MPKLHDLCQQFWEEILAATPPGDGPENRGAGDKPENRGENSAEIVTRAHACLQGCNPRDADLIRRHLLILADELNIPPLTYQGVEQLTESLFGK